MKFKKWLAGMLTAILLLANVPMEAFALSPADFSDFPNNWSRTALENALENNLLSGTGGKIKPEGMLTRAELATILTRALGASASTSLDGYSDVSEEAWYYDALSKAAAAGFLSGTDKRMEPERAATRQEVFVVLARILKLQEEASALSSFTDKDEVSDWAKGAVGALIKSGYVQGAGSRINPSHSITRAEFAQVLMNVSATYLNTPKEYTADIDGNAIVNVAGTSLKDMNISGDLILADGIGKGEATLTNVTVKGRILVRGGGSNSVHIVNSKINGEVVVNNHSSDTRLVLTESPISEVSVYSNFILDGSVADLHLSDTASFHLQGGSVRTLTVEEGASSSSITLDSGTSITSAVVSAQSAVIKGNGEIGTVQANANNIAVSVPNATVIVAGGAKGVSAGGTILKGGESAVVSSSGNGSTLVASSPASTPASNSSSGKGSSGGGHSNKTKFSGRKGTLAEPWQISTAAQLNEVREYLNGNFILTADIDLSGYSNWTPIGAYVAKDVANGDYSASPAYAFTGSFNGSGHTISNLTIKRDGLSEEDMTGAGLFGCIAEQSSLQNLTIKDAEVFSTGSCIAAFVGMAMSSNENAIKDITLSGSNQISGAGSVGGIVGSSQDTNVIDCTAQADVVMNAVSNGAGILGGGIEGGKISGCKATGSVTATETMSYGDVVMGAIGVGGLAGCAFDSEAVLNCEAKDVTIKVGKNAIMTGGLLGYSGIVNEGLFASDSEGFTLIKGSKAENVTILAESGATRIGGLVGSGFCGSNYNKYYPASSAIHIVNCIASGSITADESAIVGSILGYAFRNSAVVACDGSEINGASNQVGAADAALAVTLTDVDFVQTLTQKMARAAYTQASESSRADSVPLTTGAGISFDGGDGTEDNPWQISTAAQLNEVREHLNGNFVLTADIDLSGYSNWTPIGAYAAKDANNGVYDAKLEYAFTGSFNGGGHTISNLTIKRDDLSEEDMSGAGLFGCIAAESSLQNITIKDTEVFSTGSCVAAFVGMAMSSNENAIRDITLTGSNQISGAGSVGGIVGSAQDTNIIDCTAQADVVMNAASNGAGILGGGIEGGMISGCKATGSVTATETMSYEGVVMGAIGVGGLAGCAFDSETVLNCEVKDVTIKVGKNAIMTGGLLGYSGIVNEGLFTSDAEGFTLIKGSKAEDVTILAESGATRIGGLVGSGFCGSNYNKYYPASSAIHIVNCIASGSITADESAIVGSVLGYAFRNSAVVACDGSEIDGASNQVGAADAAQVVTLDKIK